MTIEFTYNKDRDYYCIKIYQGSEEVVRYCGNDMAYAVKKFLEEMEYLKEFPYAWVDKRGKGILGSD